MPAFQKKRKDEKKTGKKDENIEKKTRNKKILGKALRAVLEILLIHVSQALEVFRRSCASGEGKDEEIY